jgi:hypothetical protein
MKQDRRMRSTDDTKVHLIDFGLATRYKTGPRPEDHIENLHDADPGNGWFASKFNIAGESFSRRDDVIQVLYLLVYILSDFRALKTMMRLE